MADDNLRHALRHETRELHEALDRMVGVFDDLGAYGRYLAGTHRFHRVLETGLTGIPDWVPLPLSPLIDRDLLDLDIALRAPAAVQRLPLGRAACLGTLYVLEGSAIGARLLFRRAQQLGLSEVHGARHLAAQAGDSDRWRRFLPLLDDPGIDWAAAIHAARAVFQLALNAYSEPAHEPV